MPGTKAKKISAAFDLGVFLKKASPGTTISKYRTNDNIFAQGDRADSLFYIQDGKVKLSVISLARDVWQVNRFGWQQPPLFPIALLQG